MEQAQSPLDAEVIKATDELRELINLLSGFENKILRDKGNILVELRRLVVILKENIDPELKAKVLQFATNLSIVKEQRNTLEDLMRALNGDYTDRVVVLDSLSNAELEAFYAELLSQYRAAVEAASGMSDAIDVIKNHPSLEVMRAIREKSEQKGASENIKNKVDTLQSRILEGKRPIVTIYETISELRILGDKLDIDIRVEIMVILENFQTEVEDYLLAKQDLYRALAGDFTTRHIEDMVEEDEA